MQIIKSVEGNVLNVALEGRLDTMTAPELEAQVKDDIATVDSAVFDFEKLEYVSSAGLRVILSVHKSLAGKSGLVVKNPNETVSEVFEVTGFSDILTIE
ncbi:MAG: STAS domain-containing protein [Lachnospiraceae bacterium]|nr:STAS domain-containing protein [Lachnospiraceae bacterium]